MCVHTDFGMARMRHDRVTRHSDGAIAWRKSRLKGYSYIQLYVQAPQRTPSAFLRTVCINDKDNARNQSKYPHASSITYQDRILSHLRSTVRNCDPTVSVSGAPSLICISSDQRTSGGSIHPSFPSSIQGARGALHVHLAALQWPSCCLTAVYYLHRLSTALSPIR